MSDRARLAALLSARGVAMLLGVAGLAATVSGQVPSYTGLELLASVGTPNVVLPSSADFTNNTPRLNNEGLVALRFTNTATDTVVWATIVPQAGGSSTLLTSGSLFLNGGFVSTADPSINNNAIVAWSIGTGASSAAGLYRAILPGPGAFLSSQPLGANRFESPTLADSGQIGFRAGFTNGQAWASYDPVTNSTAVHLAEESIAPGSGVGFLFTPSFNLLRQIAGNSAVGTSTGPQRMLRVEANGAITVVAAANAIDPASPFVRFDASAPSINDQGDVAFIAERTAAAGGGRGVFVWRSSTGTITPIALQGQGDISSSASNNIEFFPPAMNHARVVAFRAFDAQGRRAIWAGDGATLTKLAVRGTPIAGSPSAIFVGRTDASPDFGGSVSINSASDVVFNASFNNGTALVGRGVVLARAARTVVCYANCDGSSPTALSPADFTCFLTKYRAGDSYANCDGSGGLSPADFTCFLGKYRGGCP